jgi:hypothetical protein
MKKLVKVKFKDEYKERLDYSRPYDRDRFDIKKIFFIIEIGNDEIGRPNIIPYIMVDIFRKFFSFSKLRLSKEQLLIVYDKRKKGLTNDLNFVNSFVDYENIDENYMNNLESLESFEPFIHVTHSPNYDYYDIKTVLYTCEDK